MYTPTVQTCVKYFLHQPCKQSLNSNESVFSTRREFSTFTACGDKVKLFTFHTKLRVILVFWQNDDSFYSLKTENTRTNETVSTTTAHQAKYGTQMWTEYDIRISYLIHRNGSLYFPLVQVPHCADFVSARAGITRSDKRTFYQELLPRRNLLLTIKIVYAFNGVFMSIGRKWVNNHVFFFFLAFMTGRK